MPNNHSFPDFIMIESAKEITKEDDNFELLDAIDEEKNQLN